MATRNLGTHRSASIGAASFRYAAGNETYDPFVHKFQTEKYHYLFDVNTGHIVRVDPVVWSIVEDFELLTRDELIQRHSAYFKESDISCAYDSIAHAQQNHKLLLAEYPEQVPQSSKQVIQEAVENCCQCLDLCVTENCNFRCDYCVFGRLYKDWRDHTNRCMRWETARAAIDDLVEHSAARKNDPANPRRIFFSGGEPLLNFELIKRCATYVRKQISNNDITFGLTTNGSLLTGNVADFLASEDFVVAVSLDGPARIHNLWRRRKNGLDTWDKVMANITEFVERYPRYRTNGLLKIFCTLTPLGNVGEIDTFFASHELLSEIGLVVTPIVDREMSMVGTNSERVRYNNSHEVLKEWIY